VSQLYRDATTLDRLGAEPARGIAGRSESFRSLALEDVSFTYPGADAPALDGLSLRINANESVGIVGLSGSGKTTLVDVLLGLLEPQSGKMLYNDRLLAEALSEWRAQVAYLPQQVFLVDDTLRRNVALGVKDDEIDEARLHEALRQASLAELVTQLPAGANTRLGEHGVRLSGGQRQRVALARAFYYGRDVLVMDEATSALDHETEQEIVEEIERLKGRKTVLVIAHRLSTIARCDRIIRLEDGRIVERGTYADMFSGGDGIPNRQRTQP
jgi:ABC-type multidrug transport system fused ATPase/permease subunit